jgi:hypothetical protein
MNLFTSRKAYWWGLAAAKKLIWKLYSSNCGIKGFKASC